MNILAIETSGRKGSVAALRADSLRTQVLAELVLPSGHRTAQTLAPAIRSLLEDVHWHSDVIKLISVAIGPGSFTGLRIGVTTAKTLAYVTGAAVIGVDTRAALAAAVEGRPNSSNRALWTVIDAQRGELYAARFLYHAVDGWQLQWDPGVISREAWLGRLKADELVTGPGLDGLTGALPDFVMPLEEGLWQPSSSAVGQVGWRDYQRGRRDDLWRLSPNYFRPSAAEEKLRQRERAQDSEG